LKFDTVTEVSLTLQTWLKLPKTEFESA